MQLAQDPVTLAQVLLHMQLSRYIFAWVTDPGKMERRATMQGAGEAMTYMQCLIMRALGLQLSAVPSSADRSVLLARAAALGSELSLQLCRQK